MLTIQDLIRYDGLKVIDSLVKSQLIDCQRINANNQLIIAGYIETQQNDKLEKDNLKALRDNSELMYQQQVKQNRLLKVFIGAIAAYAGYRTFK